MAGSDRTERDVFVKGIDLSEVRTTAGDLNGGDLAAVMEDEQALHEIASPTIEIVGNRKALVFAASVAQAESIYGPNPCVSVGYEVRRTKKYLSIAQNCSGENLDDVMNIPFGIITTIRIIRR
jgi:hypothetical protein